MKDVQINDYNTLAERVNVEKRKLSISLLEIGKICLEAKETLGMDNWKEWLIDSRVSIQISQAKKFIAVYKCYKDKSQSTGFLPERGVEQIYLLTRIKDDDTRAEVENALENEKLTVSQTRRLVKILKNKDGVSCEEAVQEIKNAPVKVITEKAKTISLDEYNSLKEKYELLLKEKEELEKKLELAEKITVDEQVKVTDKVLEKPVKSKEKDGTLDKTKRSIVVEGWELPIPIGINIDKVGTDLIKMSAVNYAKNVFKWKAPADTATDINIVS